VEFNPPKSVITFRTKFKLEWDRSSVPGSDKYTSFCPDVAGDTMVWLEILFVTAEAFAGIFML